MSDSEWDTKPSDRRQWQEKPLKPTIQRHWNSSDIEEFRVALVASYHCLDSDITTKFKKIVNKYPPNYNEVYANGIREINHLIEEDSSLAATKHKMMERLEETIANMKIAEEEAKKEMENFLILKYRQKRVESGQPIVKTIYTCKVPIPEKIKNQARARNTNMLSITGK
jgi:hypothetical protein